MLIHWSIDLFFFLVVPFMSVILETLIWCHRRSSLNDPRVQRPLFYIYVQQRRQNYFNNFHCCFLTKIPINFSAIKSSCEPHEELGSTGRQFDTSGDKIYSERRNFAKTTKVTTPFIEKLLAKFYYPPDIFLKFKTVFFVIAICWSGAQNNRTSQIFLDTPS